MLVKVNLLSTYKRIALSEAQELKQLPILEIRKSCNDLAKNGLIELSGKEYMLTPKGYEVIKSDVEYTQDKTIQFIKAESRISR